jgi:hypothetical protein
MDFRQIIPGQSTALGKVTFGCRRGRLNGEHDQADGEDDPGQARNIHNLPRVQLVVPAYLPRCQVTGVSR